MLLSAVTLLCMFCTVTNVASISPKICPVPTSEQWLVTGLQTRLVNSVNQLSPPDPSVLIALNLAENQDLSVKKQLVQQLKETVGKEMTSGKVALYVLALRSSCENPNDVTTPEKKNVNLVHILKKKTKAEITHLYDHGTPKTTYYQLALDTLALCVEKIPEVELVAITLAKAALANGFQSREHFDVDTGAMANLALTCVYDGMIELKQKKLVELLREALAMITKQILAELKSNGILGNTYSTGLAMQALSVSSAFYPVEEWRCPKTLERVLKAVYEGAFIRPAAASQILPPLMGKTYLDVRSPPCPFENVPITVHYTIINDLIGAYFNYHITVKVPKGSVLLTVLEEAQRAKPREFSFQTEKVSYGSMVVSINGLHESTNERTYWQFLNGKTPLKEGIDSYKPEDNANIVAIFSKY